MLKRQATSVVHWSLQWTHYGCCPDDIPLDLVFFSSFEDLCLHLTGTMESNGVRKLYEPSPVPTLYVGRIQDLLWRVPLIPCFLDGNSTSTIPHKYASRQKTAFDLGALMVQARPRGKEAMFTRSTRGCGHSGALTLALAACLCPKLNGSARRPGLRLLREAGRRSRQESVRLGDNDGYILGIYQVYTEIYAFWVNSDLCLTLTLSLPWYSWVDVCTFIWYLVGASIPLEIMHKSENWWIHKLCQSYTYYMPGIYQK